MVDIIIEFSQYHTVEQHVGAIILIIQVLLDEIPYSRIRIKQFKCFSWFLTHKQDNFYQQKVQAKR